MHGEGILSAVAAFVLTTGCAATHGPLGGPMMHGLADAPWTAERLVAAITPDAVTIK